MANTSGTIKTRYQITGTNRTTPQVSKDRFNDSMVVASAASDGKVLVKDSAQTDGWAFGEVSVAGGGTGVATLAADGVVIGNGTSPVTVASSVTDKPLVGNSGADPSFKTLPVAGGGTGVATLTDRAVVIGRATAAVESAAPGTAGIPLVSTGASTNPGFGTALVVGGGTGSVTNTDRGVLIGRGTAAIEATAAGANWRPLLGTGASTNPAFNAVTLAQTLTDGATPALDASLVPWWVSGKFRLSAVGNRTIAIPTNAVDGQKIVIEHYASGGARTLALNSGAGGFRFGTDITALTATASGKTDYIGAIYNGTDTKWDVVSVVKGF